MIVSEQWPAVVFARFVFTSIVVSEGSWFESRPRRVITSFFASHEDV